MKLSDAEIRMVEKMRKQQRQLRRWRFPLLAFYVALTIAWFIMLVEVYSFSSGDITAKLLLVSYLVPPIYAFLTLCSVQVGRLWRGDPAAELLLRLIDESQKRDA
jgi:hypothetical protein